MIATEHAKFLFKFNNHMQLDSFNYYFTKFDSVHKYNTKQKQCNDFFQFRISSESERKTLDLFKCVEECLNEILPLSMFNV